MQPHLDKTNRLDEIKTQFRAREGYYRLMNSPDYSQRSQRAMGFGTGTANSNSSTASHEKTSIKISLVRVLGNEQMNTTPTNRMHHHQQQQHLKNNQDDRLAFDSATIQSNNMIENGRRKGRAVGGGCDGVRDMKICFNVGRELFVYNYDGVRAGPDASNPIYKRYYKGSAPTCHDFNQTTASTGQINLLVGFSHGQVQLIDLNNCDDQESCKEFNVDRLIDKTRVTCIKWLPNSSSLFLVAHASGQLYLYKDDLPCGPTVPTYQLYKQTEGVCIYTCKTKTTRNPIYRWSIGSARANGGNGGSGVGGGSEHGHMNGTSSSSTLLLGSSSSSSLMNNKTDNESCALNEFVFSPCGKYLACVSQDGFLRVYCYETMELVGRARSYYGGLLCACWSPDGKYVVTGGEDDLITVWSFVERRVVARGMGHKSWISMVAFDSFYTGYDLKNSDVDNNYDDDDDDDDDQEDVEHDEEDDEEADKEHDLIDENYNQRMNHHHHHMSKFDHETRSPTSNNIRSNQHTAGSTLSASNSQGKTNSHAMTSYRFGSVGQDTQLCLWDLSDDLLQQPVAKSRTSCIGVSNSLASLTLIQNNNQATTSSSFTLPQTNSNNNNSNSSDNNNGVRCNQINKTTDQSDISEKKNDSNIQTTTTTTTTTTFGDNNHTSTPTANKQLLETNNAKQNHSSSSSGLGLLSGKGSGFTKTFSLVGKRDKRYFSQRNSDKNSHSKSGNPSNSINGTNNLLVEDPIRLLGSPICPRMNEVPMIEPTVCKKISFERLTSLVFCQGGFITSCQDGYVFSWARPSRRTLRASPGQSNEELRVIDVGTSSAV